MYEIFLTENKAHGAHPERVAELFTAESRTEAFEFCTTLEPYLRDGIEAHFVSAD